MDPELFGILLAVVVGVCMLRIVVYHFDTRYCTKHWTANGGRLLRVYGMWPRTPGPRCDGPRHRNRWSGSDQH
jgi:hypothetical protein